MSWRGDIESAAVAAINAADTGGLFEDVRALTSLMELDEILEQDHPKEPFALVKYDGATGAQGGGGLHAAAARLVVIVGGMNYGGHDARRADMQGLLDLAQAALMGLKPWASGDAWEWKREEGLVIHESGLEVWVQEYEVRVTVA